MNKEFFKLLEGIDPNKFDMVYSSPNGMTVLRSSEYGFRLDQIHELKQENFKLQARADKYKCRIDKAIDYIDDMCLCSSGYFDYGDDLSPKHIVEILRGEDNE